MNTYRVISLLAGLALCGASAFARGGWQQPAFEVHRPPQHSGQNYHPNSGNTGNKYQVNKPPNPGSYRKFAPNAQPLVHRPATGPQAGDWLRRYANLPPMQQQRMLEQDAEFRKLPPDQQQRLRQRLANFNAMSMQERERVLNRMQVFGRLTPEQRHRANELYAQFRTINAPRRGQMLTSLRQMRGMTAAQRQLWLNSVQMRRFYSPQELILLRGMSELGVGDGP